MRAGSDFSYAPNGNTLYSIMGKGKSAIPDIEYHLRRAVEADNQELNTFLHVVPQMTAS